MRIVNDEFKNDIKKYGRQLDAIITYDGITLDKSNINEITLKTNTEILKSAMRGIEIDSNVQIPLGTQLNIKCGVKLNDDFNYVDFGNYIVRENEYDANLKSFVIKAYDKMIYSMKDYVSVNTTYPCDIRTYITQLCNTIGLQFQNSNEEFTNWNKIVKDDYFVGSNYTYRDVLDQLAQVTGSIICINANDKLEIRYPNQTNEIVDTHVLKNENVKLGKKYGPINSIVLSRSAETDNIYKKDDDSITINGLTELKIKDNLFMNDNDRDTFLGDLFNKINGTEFYLCDIETTGIWYLDIYDVFGIKIEDDELYPSNDLYPSDELYPVLSQYRTLLLKNEIKIWQGTKENIMVDEPRTSETDYTKSTETDKIERETGIIVDKKLGEITITADKIKLEGYTTINDGFSIDEQGNMKARSGEIGGFNLNSDNFYSISSITRNYTQNDLTRVRNIVMGTITATNDDYEKYDLNGDKIITSQDYARTNLIVNGSSSPTQSCEYKINSDNPVHCITIKNTNDNSENVSLGMYGGYIKELGCEKINVTNGLSFRKSSGANSTIDLDTESGNISCVSLTQTSQEKFKKNFEKLENALDIIKNTDIYKYNFKNEEDNNKKHIGFVIGDNYNYSNELTSENNEGVDIYSFVSVCCQAIKELQEQIEILKRKD